MKTPLKSFKIIKKMYALFVKTYRELEPNLMICEKEDFDNIENALKDYEKIKKAFDTLSKYKDLERALGIDLITLIKIFNKGFYARIKGYDGYYLYQFDPRDIELNIERKSLIVYEEWRDSEYGEYPFKKYGKTWALTKEELEK